MLRNSSDETLWLRSRDWVLALALVPATLLAYLTVWRAGFIWDDDVYVARNPLLTASDGLWRIWFSFDSLSQYFPLTYTTFYLERLLWGPPSRGLPRLNLLLHAANALLVWRLLAQLRLPGAWMAAALFALHPVQVESVAWITERKNLLMGFFFLLSLLSVNAVYRGKHQTALAALSLALVLYALALLPRHGLHDASGAVMVLWLNTGRLAGGGGRRLRRFWCWEWGWER